MGNANTASNESPSRLWRQIVRILFFRAGKDELSNFSYRHLAVGLICTWVVGIGRYWDDPCAYPMQHLGLGSVFYVFVLAFLLWLIILPLRPAQWSYRQVLTYVTLTSPPAIIYAIPVEHFMSMKDATDANLYFLIVVAVWRVALMAQYLRLAARLPLLQRFVGMLFPVTTVITLLFLFDQHRAVFEVMGGFRHHLNPREGADVFLNEVVGCAAVACPLAALCYVVMLLIAWKKEIRSLAYRNKLLTSVVSLCLLTGIAYGVVRGVYKSPSDRLCESVYKLDSPEKGEPLWNQAIALDPNNARAFAGRAWCEGVDGRNLAAMDDYNRAVKLNPGEYLSLRAFHLKELGRTAEALDDLRAARKITNANTILDAALLSFNWNGIETLKNIPDLIAASQNWRLKRDVLSERFDFLAYQRMPHSSLDSANSWALIVEVPMLWQLRRLNEALEDCNHLVDRFELAHGSAPASTQADAYAEDSALARAYRMRGYTYELLAQKAQALADYERALATVKDDQQTLFLKARLLKSLGRESEARATFLLCRSATPKDNPEDFARYIELLTLAELGERNEAAFRLVDHQSANRAAEAMLARSLLGKEKIDPSSLQAHVGGVWSNYFDEDCSLPAKLWETGKFYEVLGMKPLARERFLSAIAWMNSHTPKARNKIGFLLVRTRLLLALGDRDGAAEAFQQARTLGYGGRMPTDDLSSIDAKFLVTDMRVDGG